MTDALLISHLPEELWWNAALENFRKTPLTPPSVEAVCARLENHSTNPLAIRGAVALAQRDVARTALLLNACKISAIDFWSPDYPECLRHLKRPPWCLYVIGRMLVDAPTLAVVGSRNPNRYGMELVREILPRLKTRPLQIISGLAFGIDALAHLHACEAGIVNFGVLGSGIDILYPVEHVWLARRILDGGGGIISEYPPGMKPAKWHFPMRNRIISALSHVVWIPQGTAKSGSLHTAEAAAIQGRLVCASPGDVFSDLSALPNRLLFEGVPPIRSAQDLDELLQREFRTTSGDRASSCCAPAKAPPPAAS
ncbi:MAG: DNA-protecting protein DprA [Deltaproteobacteria bacterium]|nr:DNA-protecting protein DprA [Deltaproteobacteria bacterium]